MSKIDELVMKIKSLKSSIEEDTTNLGILKEELRMFMVDEGLHDLKGEGYEVEIRRSFSFDVGHLGLSYPMLYSLYVKVETITKEKAVLDKKGLKNANLDAYNQIKVENTARLYIK